MLNVYQKLAKARVMLQERPLKKSGKNNYSGYSYFELADFLPEINKIFDELCLCSVISFSAEEAKMHIFDAASAEARECITISSPMAGAQLKGCHDIQNLGAVQTYLRRYLYMIALEIVENDILDKTHNANEVAEKKTKPKKENNQFSKPAVPGQIACIKKAIGLNKDKALSVFSGFNITEKDVESLDFDTAKNIMIDIAKKGE